MSRGPSSPYDVQLEEERGDLLDPSPDVLPNGPIAKVRQGDTLLYRSFRIHAPGTFERTTTTVPKAPKPRTVSNRPVSALDRVEMFTSSGSRAAPGYRIRGVDNLRAKLGRRGVGVHKSADPMKLVVTGAGIYLDAVRAASPLLVDDAPTCQVSKHKTPVPATDVAVGVPDNIPWCGDCEPSR